MVKKFLQFLYKDTPRLHEAAYLLGFFSILSHVLGFVRDRLLAHIFGASLELDIYYAAFRIPDFLFVTVASMVSLSVLVPFIVEREKDGREAVREFINNIFSFFSIIIFITCILVFVFMPEISKFLFKGFTVSELSQVNFLSRILLISPIALGFSNLFGSLTQAFNRFTVYALAPLIYNSTIILAILLLTKSMGITGVAIGVALGACFHALIQVPFVIKAGFCPRPSLSFNFDSIKRVVSLSLPRTLTLSTSHIATIFLVAMASLMPDGSISIFSFSVNIQMFPLSIIGVSYSLAAFPTLSRHFANNNLKAFTDQMSTTARHIIFWIVPITALVVVLRAQIVRVLLGTGEFSWDATRLTAAAVALFVLSSVFQSLVLLFTRGFYSAGYTKRPFILNLFSMGILVASSYVLVDIFYAHEGFRLFITTLLKVGDLSNTVVLMLPLAFTLGTVVNGVLHWVDFERHFKGFSKEVGRTLFNALGAGVIMGAVSYAGLLLFAPVFDTTSLMGIFLQGFLAGIVGILSGVGVLYLLKSRELYETWQTLHAKFWKTDVIATDPEIA